MFSLGVIPYFRSPRKIWIGSWTRSIQKKKKIDVTIFFQDFFRIANIPNLIRLPKQTFHLFLFAAWFRSIRVLLCQLHLRKSYLSYGDIYIRIFSKFRRRNLKRILFYLRRIVRTRKLVFGRRLRRHRREAFTLIKPITFLSNVLYSQRFLCNAVFRYIYSRMPFGPIKPKNFSRLKGVILGYGHFRFVDYKRYFNKTYFLTPKRRDYPFSLILRETPTNLYLTFVNAVGEVVYACSAGMFAPAKKWSRKWQTTLETMVVALYKVVRKAKINKFSILIYFGNSFKSHKYVLTKKARQFYYTVDRLSVGFQRIHGHPLRQVRLKRL